jgi:hypothetical protein
VTQSTQTVFVCDRMACPGDGVNTPAKAVVDGGGLPSGWIHLHGGAEVGAESVDADKLFHSLACFEAWMPEEFLPAILKIGAT